MILLHGETSGRATHELNISRCLQKTDENHLYNFNYSESFFIFCLQWIGIQNISGYISIKWII